MFCSNCGTNLPDGAPACPSCNKPREVATAPNAAPAGYPPPPVAPVYPPKPSQGNFMKFLNFELLITPTFIKMFYIGGSALIALVTVIYMFSGFFAFGFLAGIVTFFTSIIGGIVALVVFRIVCEALKLFFSIRNDLSEIKDKIK